MAYHTRVVPIFLFFCVSVSVVCGGSTKQKALQSTLVGLNAARDGFVTWDDQHQAKIVAEAKTYEEGKAALEAYRKDQSKAALAFEIAYKALATAALDLTSENFGAALSRALDVYNLLRKLMGEEAAKKIIPEKTN